MRHRRSALPALTYLLVMTLVILTLNLLPLMRGAYHVLHLILSVTFAVGSLPMFLFLLRPRETIPFFGLICIIYVLHFAVFPFLPVTPWVYFEYLTYDDLIPSSLLTLAGITIMVLGYYARPVQLFLQFIPRPRIEWNTVSAKRVAVVFMALGMVGIAALKTGRSFPGGGQIIVFTSNLAVIGILALYLLQLRGQFAGAAAAVLWFGYVPLFLLLAISGGNSAPIAVFFMALFMLYVGERGRIPWALVLVGVLVLFPFMYAKYEYRTLVWDQGRANFATVDEAMENVLVFARLAGETATSFDPERIGAALRAIFIRFDISYIFAHVMKLTPDSVPYLGGESYSDVFWKVVPRLVYPDKPDPIWGQQFGHMYYILDVNDLTTSINFPQIVEMYVNFGPAGVLVGMFVLSQIYRALTYFMNEPGVGDWLTVFATSIFANLFRVESNFSLVVAGVFYHVILIYVIGFFIRARPRPSVYQPQ